MNYELISEINLESRLGETSFEHIREVFKNHYNPKSKFGETHQLSNLDQETLKKLLNQGYDALVALENDGVFGSMIFQKYEGEHLTRFGVDTDNSYQMFSVFVPKENRGRGISVGLGSTFLTMAKDKKVPYVRFGASEEFEEQSRTPEQALVSSMIRRIDCKGLGLTRLAGEKGNWFKTSRKYSREWFNEVCGIDLIPDAEIDIEVDDMMASLDIDGTLNHMTQSPITKTGNSDRSNLSFFGYQ